MFIGIVFDFLEFPGFFFQKAPDLAYFAMLFCCNLRNDRFEYIDFLSKFRRTNLNSCTVFYL